jgi:hypothetical protein
MPLTHISWLVWYRTAYPRSRLRLARNDRSPRIHTRPPTTPPRSSHPRNCHAYQSGIRVLRPLKAIGAASNIFEPDSRGSCPQGFDRECKTAFKVATELCKPGPLDEKAWKEAVDVFGVSGATALVHYVGFYKYVATILDSFDAQLPPES